MKSLTEELPWASFCISTYKRPNLLSQQLGRLLEQSFSNFQIVISDNDPDRSAEEVVRSLGDPRLKYYHNGINLGMIGSFNKSIERATTDFIVMVTDDDPVNVQLLEHMHSLWLKYPGFGLYGGFERRAKPTGFVEIIEKENFITEIVTPSRTPNLLWSSCVVDKSIASAAGNIPEYGSPHLADHAFLALIGDKAGGVIVNKMYSTLTSHDSNFSKANFSSYLEGCKGFYKVMMEKMQGTNISGKKSAVEQHLKKWVMSNVYTLKKYFTIVSNEPEKVAEIDQVVERIISLEFMRKYKFRMKLKEIIFVIKSHTGLLK